MQDDNRLIELVAELLHEVRDMKRDLGGKLTDLSQKLHNLESEQRRTTNGFWELSQMLQKIVYEPLAEQAKDIAELKSRLSRLEELR